MGALVQDRELDALIDVQWPTQDPQSARRRIERLGWSLCSQGDWAYVHRSPSGRFVARVSPFEPGYGYFVELCERCTGNRYVPRIELTTELEGGGHLAVLEYLSPPDPLVVERFLRHWEQPEEADDDLRTLRREADRIDTWCRTNVRWWGGIDIGSRHVLLAADGDPKVIDLFGLSSTMLNDLVDDPHAFARHLPLEQRRYLLDMPDLQADDHPVGYLRRIRSAVASLPESEPSNRKPTP